ncbi:MAG: electron transfer flavoprotein subunit beta/FixA family protein [Spirochaetia bacterium]|nr:electron transfer flavoprotein subunit beta/FixA family protein [Spirochaetia bacterium]
MKIIVCIKQVPDTNEVRINKETGTLIRQGVPSIINPDDMHAIEQALRIKDSREDVHVTILCMGPPQADVAIREAYAMGADKAILLSDRVFAGSDTWATATILAAAIRHIGEYDIILCGRQAIDGDTAQVGPEVAEFLGLPQVTYVQGLEITGSTVVVTRATEDGYMVIESPMPVLLTAIKDLNEPRYPRMKAIYAAYEEGEHIAFWTNADIQADLSQIGVKNSPTNVKKSFVPERSRTSVELTGAPAEMAGELIKRLAAMDSVKIIGRDAT